MAVFRRVHGFPPLISDSACSYFFWIRMLLHSLASAGTNEPDDTQNAGSSVYQV